MKSVKVAKIIKRHGLGHVIRIENYLSDQSNIFVYKVFTDLELKFPINLIKYSENNYNLLCISESLDLNKLIGTFLYANTSEFPCSDGEYYIHDLIGTKVITESNDIIGITTNVFNFGASDILEIDHQKLIPFCEPFLISVDLESMIIVYSDNIKNIH